MKKYVLFVIAVAVATLFLIGPAIAQTKLTVGKAVAKTFEFIPADIGKELGFFKKRGLDIEIVAFAGGAKLEQAVAAGSVDIALDAGVGISPAIAKGSPGRIVATIGNRPHLMVLIASKDSGINTREDLKGKKIGVTSHGSLTDWLVKRTEEIMGWPKESITRVQLGGFTGQVAGMTRKQTDGFVWSADGGWEIEEKGMGKILFSFGEVLPPIGFEMIEVSTKLIKENPQAVKAFLEGWYETIAYMKANKDFTIKKVSEILAVSPEVGRKTYDLDIANLSDDGVIDEKALEYVAKSMVPDGLFPAPPDYRTLIDKQFTPVKWR